MNPAAAKTTRLLEQLGEGADTLGQHEQGLLAGVLQTHDFRLERLDRRLELGVLALKRLDRRLEPLALAVDLLVVALDFGD